jgi:O-antigen/teichoic acid export membrane protein
MQRNSLLKSVIYGFLSWFLPLGLSFEATRVIVRGLGKEQYGVYALALGFISYSFTFNIGRAIVKFVSEFKATNQTKKMSEIISATFWLNLIVGGTGMILLLFFSEWFVINVLQIENKLHDEAVNAFYLVSVIIFSTMMAQIFSSIIQAIHRFDIYSLVTVSTTSLITGGNIVLVWFNQRIEMLLVWTLFLTILSGFVFFFYSRRLLPDFKLTFGFPKAIFFLVVKYSSAVVITQSLGNFMVLFERSWIIGKLGPEAVTYYVIPLNLGIYVHAFISSITLVILPISSEVEASGDKNKLLSIYTKATKIVIVLAAFLCLTLINGRNFILYLWVGSDFAQNSSETLITQALTFSLLAVSIISFQIIEGIGLPKVSAAIVFGWSILSVPLMVVLIQDYGILGVGSARFLGSLIIVPAILYIEKRVFGKVLWKFWQRNLFIIGLSIGFTSIFQLWLFHNLPVTWFCFFCGIIGGGLIFSLVLLISGFVTEDEKKWFRRQLAKGSI